MDFIVSKVAMSICALLVVAVLGGMIHGSRSSENAYELKGVLEDLCGLVENAGRASASADIRWAVPELHNGEDLTIQISSNLVRAVIDGHSEVRRLSCTVHTWVWDGATLNSTIVSRLDRFAETMEVVSGEKVGIRVENVLLDNESILMVFLSKAA